MTDDHYGDNLRHLAEPASPTERDEAVSADLEDYQALYYAGILREWAGYMTTDDEKSSIARAYVTYIDRQVRSNQQRTVTLYAHTRTASMVLMDALIEWETQYGEEDQCHDSLLSAIEESLRVGLMGPHMADEVNRDFSGHHYDPAPEEVTVEVDGEEQTVTRDE